MDKSKKPEASSQSVVPFWRQSWVDLDRVFDNFRRDFERTMASFPAMNIPPISISSISCDILDEGDRYVIKAELPGVNKEEKSKNYVRKERKAFSYHRSLPLPEKVDSVKAKAKLDNGILSVEIPKITATPKPKSRDIPIQ